MPLLGDTIGANLDRTVAAHGDRLALVDRAPGVRWTYREFAAEVDAVALGLLTTGIGKGDRVGIWAPNRAEWTLVQYATARIGAILVNINPAYRAHELRYVLRQAGVRLLVAAREFKNSAYAAMIDEVRPDCPDLHHVVLLDGPDWLALLDSGRAGDPAELAAAQSALSPTTRSISNTPPAPPVSPRALPSRTTTSSTTGTSSASCAATPRPTGSACRSRSTTASAW